MPLNTYQVSLTTSPATLASLTSGTADLVYGFDVILKNGETAIGYGGTDNMTSVPANAGFTFTATLGYSSPQLAGMQIVSTNRIYLAASGNTTAHITIWE